MTQFRTARKDEFPQVLRMLNTVFFAKDDPAEQRDFFTLLPKLYKEQYKPWENNHCVFEDGQPVAAVGLYFNEMHVAGQALKLGGIGNVAVDPATRGKGYMKQTMDMAMQAAKAQSCDIVELSGDRHRYRYWGFDKGGVTCQAHVSAVNLRHAFGNNVLAPGWAAKPVAPGDTEALAQIQAFVESAPLHLKHNRAAMHDILCSWRETPWAIWHEERLAGWFTLSHNGKQAGQLQICEWVQCLEMPLRAVLSVLPEGSGITTYLPTWRQDMIAKLEPLTEQFSVHSAGQYCVFNWENTLRALLALQAQCKTLLDGRMTVCIHGYAGPETLAISVEGNQANVEKFSGQAELTFDYLAATNYFLGLLCAARRSPVAQNWFPLPMMLYGMDKV